MFLSRPPTTCTHNVQFLLAVSERLISLKCFLETTPQVLKRIKYRFFFFHPNFCCPGRDRTADFRLALRLRWLQTGARGALHGAVRYQLPMLRRENAAERLTEHNSAHSGAALPPSRSALLQKCCPIETFIMSNYISFNV